jgi:hypothetical protein
MGSLQTAGRLGDHSRTNATGRLSECSWIALPNQTMV